MLIPKRNHFDLWEDMFKDPFFSGNEASKIMNTDIRETEKSYLIDIDLPGYEKENIKLDVENGYLTIQATVISNTEENENPKFVRKERYMGSCSRSFYVGKDVKNEDIKASFKNGTLKIEVPKKDLEQELPEKKYIQIED